MKLYMQSCGSVRVAFRHLTGDPGCYFGYGAVLPFASEDFELQGGVEIPIDVAVCVDYGVGDEWLLEGVRTEDLLAKNLEWVQFGLVLLHEVILY